jgi:hypothetical protein
MAGRNGNPGKLRDAPARRDLVTARDEPGDPTVTKLRRMDSPSNDERLSFATDIKPLFRQHDRQSMEKALDLWSYDDVRARASDILERVKTGSMPCDGAWPSEQVQVFQRWVDSGMAP